jgi:hypothetical protein
MRTTNAQFRTSVFCASIVFLGAFSGAISSDRGEERRQTDITEGVGTVLEIAVPQEHRPYMPRDRGLRRINRPIPNLEQFQSKDRSDPAFRNVEYVYLRFEELPDYGRRWVLRGEGLLLTDYVKDNTYIAAVNPDGRRFLQTATGITEMGPMPLEDKIEAALLEGRTHDKAIGPSGLMLLDVRFHPTVSLDEAREVVETSGGTVLNEGGFTGLSMLHVAISAGAIESFAGADIVARVSMKPPEIRQLNLEAARWSNTDVMWEAPYNLSGAGLSIAFFDDGAIHPHPEFGSRIIQYVDWPGLIPPDEYDSHATHAAGTIGASGELGPAQSIYSHGMANQIGFYDFDPSGYNTDMNAAINAGFIHGAYHGWGYNIGWFYFEGCDQSDGCLPPIAAGWYFSSSLGFGIYDANTEAVDISAYFAESTGQIFPIVFPAGNDRGDALNSFYYDGTYHYNPDEIRTYYDTIGPPGSAKNCITVGAITDGENMTDFSSWGPTDDGRVKPDLVAKGYAHSPSDDTLYETQVGTSTAAAVVAGSAMLLIEEYTNVFATQPTNGELKALLLHTAKDLGNPGPDAVYGFGLLNTQEAVELLHSTAGPFSITNGALGTNQIDSYNVTVLPGTPWIKATLAWMDNPAPASVTGFHLVNNLDLRLISPSGASYHAFSLDPADPVADATAFAPNIRDTVEQVWVEFPEEGTWTVEVKGEAVPIGPQKYGLVSGILNAPSVYDHAPPQVPANFPIPYRRPTIGARFADPTGIGIDTDSVVMNFWDIDVTDISVITSDGIQFVPPADLHTRDHYYTVTVTNLAGVTNTEYAFFDHVRADAVANLTVDKGGSGQAILNWGDADFNPDVLWSPGFRVYRSTDLQAELEQIGSTALHNFTDPGPPAVDVVFYEVHQLFEGVSGHRILSIRDTTHRTQQPFIGAPRPSNLEEITSGDTVLRIFGMAEPGADVKVYVDGSEVGSTTALPGGSFTLMHDFGASGPYTLHVQAKVDGKSISVPSWEVAFEIP